MYEIKTEEFLNSFFILLGRKLQGELNSEEVSNIFEAINKLKTNIDFSKEGSLEYLSYLVDLEKIIYDGFYKDKKILKEIGKALIPQERSASTCS